MFGGSRGFRGRNTLRRQRRQNRRATEGEEDETQEQSPQAANSSRPFDDLNDLNIDDAEETGDNEEDEDGKTGDQKQAETSSSSSMFGDIDLSQLPPELVEEIKKNPSMYGIPHPEVEPEPELSYPEPEPASESSQPLPSGIRRFDFRNGDLPMDVEVIGGEPVLEVQRDRSTALVIPPMSNLKLSLNLPPDSGSKNINCFSVTMDIKIDAYPNDRCALLQTNATSCRITEGEAFIYPGGGVGVYGDVGLEDVTIKPDRWTRVTITVGPSGAAGMRCMTTYVNGKKCSVVSSIRRGVLGKIDGPFSLSSKYVLVHASSDELSMPGMHVKYIEVRNTCFSDEEVKKAGMDRRMYSYWALERQRQTMALFQTRALKPLYKKPPPVWNHPALCGMFGDAFFEGTALEGGQLNVSISMLHLTLQRALREMNYLLIDSGRFDHDDLQICNLLSEVTKDGSDLCRRFALAIQRGGAQVAHFIKYFKKRLSSLKIGELMLVPGNIGHFVLFIVEREADDDYRFSVVNTNPYNGLDYHAVTAQFAPKYQYKTVLSVKHVAKAKMLDDVFWSGIFFLALQGRNPTTCDKLYDFLIPFLAKKPLDKILGDNASDDFVDWRSPQRSPIDHVACVTEAFHYILRKRGMTLLKSDVFMLALKMEMAVMVESDLNFVESVTDSDRKVIKLVMQQIAYTSAKLAERGGLTLRHLTQIHVQCQRTVDKAFGLACDDANTTSNPPLVDVHTDKHAVKDNQLLYPFIDRLRRLDDVDGLAGAPLTLPRYVPVDALQIPARVLNLEDAVAAIRYCDKLCTLISVQPHCVKNRSFLKSSLIEYVFTQVVPVPKPPTAVDYIECIWGTNMRYGLQLDVLILLQRIMEHFASSTFSIYPTRPYDAVRLVVSACIAAIADVVIRKKSSDIPSELCDQIISGYGLSLGHFDTQSETIEVHMAELHICRTSVLDYFENQNLEEIMSWEVTSKPEPKLMQFFARLCVKLAFPRDGQSLVSYLIDPSGLVIKNYPEFACYRDIAFYFKFFQNTDTSCFPGLTEWTQRHAEIKWTMMQGEYVAQAFGSVLSPRPTPPLTFTHRYPSLAIASNLTKPHEVRTEDDVLHIKNLPSFEDCISQADSELLISYLTVPYIRVPLVLSFFSTEDRIHSLRNKDLQTVLDSVIFEPGRYLNTRMNGVPQEVPTMHKQLLATPYGLLINELQRSPEMIIDSILRLVKLALDLDTGTVKSTTTPILLYVIRLAARMDNYLSFIIDHTKGEHDCVSVKLRDTEITPDILQQLEKGRSDLRAYLWGPIHLMLEAWCYELLRECQKVGQDDATLDNNARQSCELYCHLLFAYRNVKPAQLTIDNAATIVCAFCFLTSRHTWNLNLLYGIPETEVFECLTVVRRRLVNWTRQLSQDDFNLLMESVVRVTSGTGVRRAHTSTISAENERNWAFVRGDRNLGRFTVQMDARRRTVHGSKRKSTKKDSDKPITSSVMGTEVDEEGYDEYGNIPMPPQFGGADPGMQRAAENAASTVLQEDNEIKMAIDNDYAITTKMEMDQNSAALRLADEEGFIPEVSSDAEFGVEIDFQTIQLTLKASHLKALDTSIASDIDVQTIFGATKSMQASTVESCEHREWVHLVGRSHDIHYWRTPDPRPETVEFDRDYLPGELEESEEWIVPIFEPVRLTYLVEPFELQICLPSRALPYGADVAMMIGLHPKTLGCWKEIIVFKSLRIVHIYNVYSHGRRFYRSLEYTTNALYCLRDMQPTPAGRTFPWPVWERHGAGHPYAAYENPLSCVIWRSYDHHLNLSGGQEQFVPQRLLHGIIPSALLDKYLFWQDEDDNLRGYGMADDDAYIIFARLKCCDRIDSTMLPGHAACIVRLMKSNEQQLKTRSDALLNRLTKRGLVHPEFKDFYQFFKAAREICRKYELIGKSDMKEVVSEAIDQLYPEPSSRGVNRQFNPIADVLSCVDNVMEQLNMAKHMSFPDEKSAKKSRILDQEDLVLLDLLYSKPKSKLRSIANIMTRVENLSYVLCWTKMSNLAKKRTLIPRHKFDDQIETDEEKRPDFQLDVYEDIITSPVGSVSGVASSDGRKTAGISASGVRIVEAGTKETKAEVDDDDDEPMDEDNMIKVDLIELPRIKIAFHEKEDDHGITRIYSMDHSDLFISNHRSDLTTTLMQGIPHSLLLQDSNEELHVLVPCIDPVRPPIAVAPFSTELVLNRASAWYSVLDTCYFLYPVHVSLSFLFTPTLSSALYLMLLRFLNRNYDSVFRLAETIGTDTDFSKEEEMIFTAFGYCNDDNHPDAHACRLKTALVTIDSPVLHKCPWDLTIQTSRHVVKANHVSMTCRIKRDDEFEILNKCITDITDPRFDPRIYQLYDIYLLKNRIYYLRNRLNGSTVSDTFYVPKPRDSDWVRYRDMSFAECDSNSWMGIEVQYAAPRNLSGYAVLEKIGQFWSEEENLFGATVNCGFLYIYELLTGTKKAKITGVDASRSLAYFLSELLSDRRKPSLMGSIINVLTRLPNPDHLISLLPKYRDNRRQKTTVVKGYPEEQEPISPLDDLFSQLLPNLSSNIGMIATALNMTNVLFETMPSALSRTLSCEVKLVDGREWFFPEITNFGKSTIPLRRIGANQEQSMSGYRDVSVHLPAAISINGKDLSDFSTLPLRSLGAESIVTFVSRASLGQPVVPSDLPFDVSKHDQANSAVAASMIQRLKNDMTVFANQQNDGLVPRMNLLTSLSTCVDESNVKATLDSVLQLIASLEGLRDEDAKYVDASLGWIRNASNYVELRQEGATSMVIDDGGDDSDLLKLIFLLRRFSGQEATLWLEFLFATLLSSNNLVDLRRINPFLAEETISCLSDGMLGCILHANRIGQVNRCIGDARDVQALLEKLLSSKDNNSSKEILSSVSLKGESLAGNLSTRRYFVNDGETILTEDSLQHQLYHDTVGLPSDDARFDVFKCDPRFLLFEFTWNILLRRMQVVIVNDFMGSLKNNQSRVKQMIMGAGKTTVVAPLLTLMLADGEHLVMQVVPPALLEFTRSILRSTFSSIMYKRIFTLNYDRASEPDSNILKKLRNASRSMGVVVSTPTTVKSVLLKFLELLDLIRDPSRPRHPAMETDCNELGRILDLFSNGYLLMDEVDLILHPMKSELNFPIGAKHELDFSPQRWQLPIHILDAIFYCERGRMSVGFRQSSRAGKILERLKVVIMEGYKLRALQRNPHIILLNPDWYHVCMKPIIVEWVHLWLEAQHLSGLNEDQIQQYVLEGASDKKNPELAAQVSRCLTEDHKKMINLAHDWTRSYLPHVLQKIDRVSFGIMNKEDYDRAIQQDPRMPRTRAKLAIPFVGKDVPSRSSEFAHPDVIIGLTILGYRYEGLRWADFEDLVGNLRSTLTKEVGPWDKRKSSLRYTRWVKEAGGKIRGRTKYLDERIELNNPKKGTRMHEDEELLLASSVVEEMERNLKENVEEDENKRKKNLEEKDDGSDDSEKDLMDEYKDDLEVVPLRLLKPSNFDQMMKLFNLIRLLPDTIHWYLESFIFPSYMRHQTLKLSACGQEVGGDMLFKKRIGFSGTPSDLLPIELGRCGYEKGSDGQMVHVMSSPEIVSYEVFSDSWSVSSLLDRIATAEHPRFHALIDTGALITGLTNLQVARHLMSRGLSWCDGIVFLDEFDRKMVLVRATGRVVKMAQCGIPAPKRFAFYDQVHTTGMDIKHVLNAKAILTLGKDMVFRDYAQGAFRMRQIAKGQTIHLFIIPEVAQLMNRELIKAGYTASKSSSAEFCVLEPLYDEQVVSLEKGSDRVHMRRILTNVNAWLVINSMKSERVQFNQLCLQNVANVWKKESFALLLNKRRDFRVSANMSVDRPEPEAKDESIVSYSKLNRSLNVFCEPIDFTLEADVPEVIMFEEVIRNRAKSNSEFVSTQFANDVVSRIVKMVANCKMEDDDDRVLSAEMVQEQEQEKEKMQEQEQEQEIEIEKYVDLAYSREDEEPKPWLFASLQHQPSVENTDQFYAAKDFKLYKRKAIDFPDYVHISNNYFDKRWSGARRIKNVVMVLEWVPDSAVIDLTCRSYEPLSAVQEEVLDTAIRMFDLSNLGHLTRQGLRLILRSAAHQNLKDDELDHVIREAKRHSSSAMQSDDGHAENVTYDDIRQMVTSGKFSSFENGRHFVAISLAEAETIRRIMHLRLHSQVIPGKSTAIGLRCIPAGSVMTDHSLAFAECASDYMPLSSFESLRFLNCDMFFSEKQLNIILRALHKSNARERRKFFVDIIGCRRRLAHKWTETPLVKLFTISDQFGMLKQRALSVRLRESIRAIGLMLYDAFNKFDFDKNGFLSPGELWGGFEYLNIPMTAMDIVEFIRANDMDKDCNLSYREFVEALQDPENQSKLYQKGELTDTDMLMALEETQEMDHDDDDDDHDAITESKDNLPASIPMMRKQASYTSIAPRGEDEVKELMKKLVIEEARLEKSADRHENEEELRIKDELEREEDERDRTQEGGRNPKIYDSHMEFDFTTGRRPRGFNTRGDVHYVADTESSNGHYLKVYAPSVMFLKIPFAGNCGGFRLNHYTIVAQVRFEIFAPKFALFSTAPFNETNAFAYVDGSGRVGTGMVFGEIGGKTLNQKKWAIVAAVVDTLESQVTMYVNGEPVSIRKDEEDNVFDGSCSIHEQMTLFGSKATEECNGGEIKHLWFFSRLLSLPEVVEATQRLNEKSEGDVIDRVVQYLVSAGSDQEVAMCAAMNAAGETFEEKLQSSLDFLGLS